MLTTINLKQRINNILAQMLCRSSNLSRIGKDASNINNDIIELSVLHHAINTSWTLEQLKQTECFIKKFER